MQTVLITGASGNLGQAVTEKFAKGGYQVIAIVHSEADKEKLNGHKAVDTRIADLINESGVAQLVADLIAQYKHIDAALLLAGGFSMGAIDKTGSADIRRQVELNFETAYHVVRPLFAHMMERKKGRMVLIGGRPAIERSAAVHMIGYSLSKAMLMNLGEYLNEAARGTNVTATVIVPSTIDTPVNRKAMPGKDPSDWVRPEELADIMEFVVSEKSNAIREPVIKVYNNA